MESRERLDKALKFEETDRPPHFENTFELVNEAFGLNFLPYEELYKATKKERDTLFGKIAEIYARTIEKYKWDAVPVWMPGSRDELQYEFIPFLKKYVGENFPVFNDVWTSFVSLETVKDYMQFSIQIAEEPEEVHKWAKVMLE